jgi:arylsulfatase A-like enzyme
MFQGLFLSGIALAADRPNFVLILTDDQRYDLLGCNGNELIKTPNIDNLARDGVRFTNGYVTSAICTPSRVSILLSQYERKHGVNFNSGTSVAPEAWEQSYPVVMRQNGYYAGYIGKNHSPIGEGGYESGLIEGSFDYWYAAHGHLRFYPKQLHKIFRGAKSDTQVEILNEGMEDFFSNERRLEGAVHFLESLPEDKPFCLSICFNLPHGAGTGTMKMLDSDPEMYKSLYRDIDIPLPRNYTAKADIRSPKLPAEIHFAHERQSGYDYVDNEKDLKERIIREMQTVSGIDALVGNLREKLEEMGLDKNTIIIFTSDHGLFHGEFGLGGKALCYQVTTHVPYIIYNPMLPRKARGRVSDELVQTIDIAPTLLDFAGIPEPGSFQGKSIRDILEGRDSPVREYLFTENLWSTQFGNPRCESVQNKEWKYIRYYENRNLGASVKIEAAKMLGMNVNDMLYKVHDNDIPVYRSYIEAPFKGEEAVYEELFHLSEDPDETTNLANDSKYSKILEEMRLVCRDLIREARGTGDPKVLRFTADSKFEKIK